VVRRRERQRLRSCDDDRPAEYFAKIPKAQRRRTIIFLGSSDHHNSTDVAGFSKIIDGVNGLDLTDLQRAPEAAPTNGR
jgi:hypothetical protein